MRTTNHLTVSCHRRPYSFNFAEERLAAARARHSESGVGHSSCGGRRLGRGGWRSSPRRPLSPIQFPTLLMACWLSVDTKQIEVRPTKVHTMAKARALIGAASFDPDTLKMIGQAFDDAWASVAQSYTSPLAIEAARLKLANIVLSLAADGVRDPAHLCDRACRILAIDEPRT